MALFFHGKDSSFMTTNPLARLGVLCLVIALLFPFASLLASSPGDAAKELKSVRKKMARAVGNADESRVRELLRDLEEINDPGAVELMLKGIAAIDSSKLLDAGIEILTGLGSERLSAYAEEAVKNKKKVPSELAVLILAGSGLTDERSETWLLDALAHPSGLVKRSALDAVNKRRSKNAIPRLIDLLEQEGIDRNTVAFDARVVLISLTGRDFTSIEDWRNFWEGQKDTIDSANLKKDADGPTSVKLITPEAPEFFGVELVSERVMFVIDISGSMQKYDEGSTEKGERGSSWEVRQRIRRVKNQLSRTIRKLSGKTRFNIVAFNEVAYPFQKKLVPASKSYKGKALKFIKRLNADKGTDTGKAFREAFKDKTIDTIVLLSDGAPHHQGGEPSVLIPKVEALVKDLNRIRKVKIFTFGFEGQGEWPPGSKYKGRAADYDPHQLVEFLKRLAKNNRGKYTRVE